MRNKITDIAEKAINKGLETNDDDLIVLGLDYYLLASLEERGLETNNSIDTDYLDIVLYSAAIFLVMIFAYFLMKLWGL